MRIVSSFSSRSGASPGRARSISMLPTTPVSGLLISCAAPDRRRPRAASFSDSFNLSRRTRSSRAVVRRRSSCRRSESISPLNVSLRRRTSAPASEASKRRDRSPLSAAERMNFTKLSRGLRTERATTEAHSPAIITTREPYATRVFKRERLASSRARVSECRRCRVTGRPSSSSPRVRGAVTYSSPAMDTTPASSAGTPPACPGAAATPTGHGVPSSVEPRTPSPPVTTIWLSNERRRCSTNP